MDSIGEIPETQMEDTITPDKDKQLSGSNNGRIAAENGVSDGGLSRTDGDDQLLQTVIELGFQNEYLKSQFEGFKNFQAVDRVSDENVKGNVDEEGVRELRETVESLKKQLLEEKQTRVAAEEALKHLQVAHSEADAKAQELSVKLIEGQIFVWVYSYVHYLCESYGITYTFANLFCITFTSIIFERIKKKKSNFMYDLSHSFVLPCKVVREKWELGCWLFGKIIEAYKKRCIL